MADDTPAEAAKRRRRWLTLGEIIAVLALVISAASFWDSHQQRQEDRAIAAREKSTPTRVAPLILTASADAAGDVLRLATPGNDRVIQTQTIVFPTALGVASVDTVGNPRIESGWFADQLRDAVGDARTNARLPIGIITRYTDSSDGGTERTDTAIYDIGHGWRERLLQRDVPVLEGITLVTRGGKDLQKRLDARWNRSHPAKG